METKTKTDKILDRLEKEVPKDIDKIFLEIVIDLHNRLTILENKEQIKNQIMKISKPLINDMIKKSQEKNKNE